MEEHPPAPDPAPAASKASWSRLGVHRIQLLSTAWVDIRIPDLSVLLVGGAVPEGLRGIALTQVFDDIRSHVAPDTSGVADEGETTATPEAKEAEQEEQLESLRQLVALQRWLVSQMLVEPQLTAEELDPANPDSPPPADVTLLTLIAIRERDTDARGVTIGVEPLHRWAHFREEHGCPPGCEACHKVRQRFSSAVLGDV